MAATALTSCSLRPMRPPLLRIQINRPLTEVVKSVPRGARVESFEIQWIRIQPSDDASEALRMRGQKIARFVVVLLPTSSTRCCDRCDSSKPIPAELAERQPAPQNGRRVTRKGKRA